MTLTGPLEEQFRTHRAVRIESKTHQNDALNKFVENYRKVSP